MENISLGRGLASVRALLQDLSDDVDGFDTVIVSSGGDRHHCHSAVLASASPFLRKVLLEGGEDKCLFLPHFRRHIVENFLEILYCGPDPDYYEYSFPDLAQMASLAQMLRLNFGQPHVIRIKDDIKPNLLRDSSGDLPSDQEDLSLEIVGRLYF